MEVPAPSVTGRFCRRTLGTGLSVSRRRMRQVFLMLSLMLIVMLAVHFKKVSRANLADSASMVETQSMFLDMSRMPLETDAIGARDEIDPRDKTAAAEMADVGD
jgi:hypothetical protein